MKVQKKKQNEMIEKESKSRKYWLIYSGLTGGFNSVRLHSVMLKEDLLDEEDHLCDIVRDLNWEEFESVSGMYGVIGYEEALEAGREDNPEATEEELEDYIQVYLTDELETWTGGYYIEFDPEDKEHKIDVEEVMGEVVLNQMLAQTYEVGGE